MIKKLLRPLKHSLESIVEHWVDSFSKDPIPSMEYTLLGRSQIRVSVAGLGSGGSSRLGLNQGKDPTHAVRLLQKAFDFGVTLVDTSEAYKTEEIIRQALTGSQIRDQIVISSKKKIVDPEGNLISKADLSRGLEDSLKKLGRDHIDIYHLHGVKPKEYEQALETLVPEMLHFKQTGKVRAIGITETFSQDPSHEMLQRALKDDWVDVILLGFNLLNFSARHTILTTTRKQDIGVLGMFAVRKSLQSRHHLQKTLHHLSNQQPLSANLLTALAFLDPLTDTAYRFCRHEPGIHSVLFGTGSLIHLGSNIRSLLKPPLAQESLDKIESFFSQLPAFSDS